MTIVKYIDGAVVLTMYLVALDGFVFEQWLYGLVKGVDVKILGGIIGSIDNGVDPEFTKSNGTHTILKSTVRIGITEMNHLGQLASTIAVIFPILKFLRYRLVLVGLQGSSLSVLRTT